LPDTHAKTSLRLRTSASICERDGSGAAKEAARHMLS
jgi:hypothetical protein